jgi:rare lipoprotein A
MLLLGCGGVWGCVLNPSSQVETQRAADASPMPVRVSRPEVGLASWYGAFHQGLLTASGEIFDMGRLTAAHRTLPLGTHLRVTNLENGRVVRVRVNDRGPYVLGRVLDLSLGAARLLGMVERGVALVRLEVERA